MNNVDSWKPHWARRTTAQREKAKGKCLFDTVCTVMIMVYTIGLFLWILNDAFPHLFW